MYVSNGAFLGRFLCSFWCFDCENVILLRFSFSSVCIFVCYFTVKLSVDAVSEATRVLTVSAHSLSVFPLTFTAL